MLTDCTVNKEKEELLDKMIFIQCIHHIHMKIWITDYTNHGLIFKSKIERSGSWIDDIRLCKFFEESAVKHKAHERSSLKPLCLFLAGWTNMWNQLNQLWKSRKRHNCLNYM